MNSGCLATNVEAVRHPETNEPECQYHRRIPVFVMACCLIVCMYANARAGEKNGHAVKHPWSLSTLMKDLAQVKSDNPRFVQRQYLHALTKPLVSSGELVYKAPDYLEQKTELPSPQRAVIQGDRLTLYSPAWKGPRTLSLQDNPGIWAIVESLRATLSGQLPVLLRYFDVKMNGSNKHWRLEFKPRAQMLKKQVDTIFLDGRNKRIDSIEIHYDGKNNYSVTQLSRSAP